MLKFEIRRYGKRLSAAVKPFEVSEDMDKQAIEMILIGLLESLRPDWRKLRAQGSQAEWSKMLRKQKINSQRQIIYSFMQRQSLVNIKEAAKYVCKSAKKWLIESDSICSMASSKYTIAPI